MNYSNFYASQGRKVKANVESIVTKSETNPEEVTEEVVGTPEEDLSFVHVPTDEVSDYPGSDEMDLVANKMEKLGYMEGVDFIVDDENGKVLLTEEVDVDQIIPLLPSHLTTGELG